MMKFTTNEYVDFMKELTDLRAENKSLRESQEELIAFTNKVFKHHLCDIHIDLVEEKLNLIAKARGTKKEKVL